MLTSTTQLYLMALLLLQFICEPNAFHIRVFRPRISTAVYESSFKGRLDAMFRKIDPILPESPGITLEIDPSTTTTSNNQAIELCDAYISGNRTILIEAVERRVSDTDEVVEALLRLEKLTRERNKLDGGQTSLDTIKNLDGTWRLIFTTGTVDTQKKFGRRINYFPLKAQQSFNTTDYSINNGIYIGDFTLLKFYGAFEWKEKPRKLEFDFDRIELFGLQFNLPKGKAAELGQSTGLGSEGNVQLQEKGRKPFFNWISADGEIATARGGGGGLALWKRVI